MKAVIFQGLNKPLAIEELRKPEPKEGEVLVRVASCGVCHSDLHVIKGELKFPTPSVLGHEIAGIVEKTGSKVKNVKKGEPVVGTFIMPCGSCYYCSKGMDDLCEKFFNLNRLHGKLYDGSTRLYAIDGSPVWMYSMAGLAEYSVIPATAVFKIPASLPLQESCILGCAAFTAFGAIKNQAELKGGENIAVVAVGGVGSSIVHLSRAFKSSTVIAVDVHREKLEMAKMLGANEVVNGKEEDPVKKVLEITSGRGADVVFEALGRPETILNALGMVRDGGKVVLVGIAPLGLTVPIEITRLVRRGIRIMGSYGARTRQDTPQLLRLASRGLFDVKKLVSRKLTLEEAPSAYESLSRGEIIGRAIVVNP